MQLESALSCANLQKKIASKAPCSLPSRRTLVLHTDPRHAKTSREGGPALAKAE